MNYKVDRNTLIFAILIITGISTANHANAASGDLDPTFGNGGRVQTSFPGSVTKVWIQPNGKIITQVSQSIFRLNPDGTLDSTFGSNGQIGLNAAGDFAGLPDGKILATTTVYSPVYQQWFGVVYRFDADGHPDTTFGSNGSTEFDLCYCDTRGYKIAIGLNGQFFVAALISTTPQSRRIVRFNADGTQSNFGVNSPEVRKMVVQPDGKLIVSAHSIGRYNSDGTFDYNFGTGGWLGLLEYPEENDLFLGDFALQADGKILVSYFEAGIYYSFSGTKRFNSDGTQDTTYFSDSASVLAIQSDGKILAGSGTVGHQDRFILRRFLRNGHDDYSFGEYGLILTGFPGLSSTVHALAIQPDGKIIAAGGGYSSSGGNRVVLARYENQIPRLHPSITTVTVGLTSRSGGLRAAFGI